MPNFRIIPLFLANSSMPCDDITHFAIVPSLKLLKATFPTLSVKGKIPLDFEFDELIIRSRSFTSSFHAAEEKALTYWEGFKLKFQLTGGSGTPMVSIEPGKNGDLYLFVIDQSTNLPLMRFYIDESW